MTGWGVGVAMALFAVLGLFVAAGADDATMEWVGLLWAVFGVGYVYSLIIKNTGH